MSLAERALTRTVSLQGVQRLMVLVLLFLQPLSVLIVAATGLSLNFSYLYVLLALSFAVSVLGGRSVGTFALGVSLLVLVSFVLSYLVSGSESLIVSAGTALQYLVALLVLSKTGGAASQGAGTRRYFLVFGLLMLPNILIGLLQSLTNTPLFIGAVLGAQSLVLSEINNIWRFGNSTRSFGLFYTNAYYGLYLIPLLSVSYVGLISGRGRVRGFSLLAFAGLMVALLLTYTRTAYVQTLLMLMTYPLLLWFKRVRLSPWWSFLIMTAAALTLFAGLLVYGVRNEVNDIRLNNSQSLAIRVHNWEQLGEAMAEDPVRLIVGYGIVSNEVLTQGTLRPSQQGTNQSVIVDNGYLATMLSGGLILLVLQLVVQYKVFERLYRNFLRSPQIVEAAAVAFYGCITLYNLFGTLNSSLLILGVAPLLYSQMRSRT